MRIRRTAGRYGGQCAEYCGGPHALMGLTVTACPADFRRLMQVRLARDVCTAGNGCRTGRAPVRSAGCAACHRIAVRRPMALPGPTSPSSAAVAPGAGILPNNRGTMMGWSATARNKPNNRMPPYTMLSGEDDRPGAYLEAQKYAETASTEAVRSLPGAAAAGQRVRTSSDRKAQAAGRAYRRQQQLNRPVVRRAAFCSSSLLHSCAGHPRQLSAPLLGVRHRNLQQFFNMHGTLMMFLFAVPMWRRSGCCCCRRCGGARPAVPASRLTLLGVFHRRAVLLHVDLAGLEPDGGWFMYRR